jgi:hypothetical protein
MTAPVTASWATCRNCGRQIVKIRLLGWVHENGLFLCRVPTKDATDPAAWKHAEPIEI